MNHPSVDPASAEQPDDLHPAGPPCSARLWQHGQMLDCPFCLPAAAPRIVIADEHCFSMWTEETPEGSAMVVPRVHRVTMFDLTEQEWASTRVLLEQMRELVAAALAPDGWNIGWNVATVGGQSVPHAHCHLVPRYEDEPLAGRGIRSWIKDPFNRPRRHPAPGPPYWSTATTATTAGEV